MNISEFFLRRPVGTTLLGLALLLVGAAAFRLLPIASLPLVDLSAISVSAALPGASPETMASSVATPLERQFSHIAGISAMSSSNTLGITQIDLRFDFTRDINGASRDVEAAINAARTYLPANLPANPTYRKIDSARAPVLVLNLTSRNAAPGALYDTASSILQQKISQIAGVGQVQVLGGSLPAVRVEIDPLKLSRFGIGLPALAGELAAQNVTQPKGQIEFGDTIADVLANDQISEAREYKPLIVGTGATGSGAVVRLQDVATVSDSVQNVRSAAYVNSRESVSLLVYCVPGANVIATVDAIKRELPSMQASIPAGQRLAVTGDLTTTIRASVFDIESTLVLSIVLVVLVVFAFLRDLRSASIPSVAVIVSIVSTFAAMYLLRYTLDNLSLMALAISTGFVVDDAIVVMENAARLIELGASPMEAARKGAEVTGPTVVSMSLSLIAVFVPIFFLRGIAGRLFHEFAAVLMISIFISMVVSLTITPMMCSLLLQPAHAQRHGKAFRWTEHAFNAVLEGYRVSLQWALRHPRLVLLLFASSVLGNGVLIGKVKKGLFPLQDTGALIGGIQGPQDASFTAMQGYLRQVESIIQTDPAVDVVTGFTGSSSGPGSDNGSNSCFLFVSLKPAPARELSASEIIDRLRPRLDAVGAVITSLKPIQEFPSNGKKSNASYQYAFFADNTGDLNTFAQRYTEALRREPEFRDVTLDQQSRGLETMLHYDRLTAARLGVTPQMIDQTLYGQFGQAQVSTIYKTLNQYYVVMEAAPHYTQDQTSLHSVYLVPGGSGAVPLDSIARWNLATAPLSVFHSGLYPAATVSFNLRPGVSLGEAAEALVRLQQHLSMPATVRGGLAGDVADLKKSSLDQVLLFALALGAIYVTLGILYESLVHPLTILSTLPPASVGAMLALILFHSELDVISGIGILLLIGIVKKNAIMMIDFALLAERKEGKTSSDAIFEACLLRFRPILMTTLAALFAALPLALSRGAGSELRRPLGIAVSGGLMLSQVLTLYTTPVIYLVLDRLRLRFARRERNLHGLPAPESVG